MADTQRLKGEEMRRKSFGSRPRPQAKPAGEKHKKRKELLRTSLVLASAFRGATRWDDAQPLRSKDSA
jgi:hypothetical protein